MHSDNEMARNACFWNGCPMSDVPFKIVLAGYAVSSQTLVLLPVDFL
jgi:hypothetical protein